MAGCGGGGGIGGRPGGKARLNRCNWSSGEPMGGTCTIPAPLGST